MSLRARSLRRYARGALASLVLAGQASSEPMVPLPDPSCRDYSLEPVLVSMRGIEAGLAQRERDVAARERGVEELEAVLAARTGEIEELRDLVARRIAAWEEQNAPRISRLSKIYAAMPSTRAADLLERLDAGLATQIIAKMKHKQSAAVMTKIEDRRALLVTRQVAHPLSYEPTPPSGETP